MTGPPLPVVADPARPHVIAVRVCRAEQRAVIAVADGEGVSERVVEGNIFPREVRHGGSPLVRDPLVVLAAVPRRLRVGPAVRCVFEELHSHVVCGRVERQHVTGAIRLEPHRLSGRKHRGARVAIAAHTAHRAEVMIERPVFLHQEDDVLDVFDGACTKVRRHGSRLLDALGERGGESGTAEGTQECTAIDWRHETAPRAKNGMALDRSSTWRANLSRRVCNPMTVTLRMLGIAATAGCSARLERPRRRSLRLGYRCRRAASQ